MKRILLLLLFVVNLQITITDSAIGLRCGAVTHAQTMAREVNGGCEYSDGNGWSLWTPMPCDPVIANGYPCSYCHKGHDTDIQREIHIETECPEYTTSCPKCHTTLLRKELANHQCSGISNSSDSNDSNNGSGNSLGGGGLVGGHTGSSNGSTYPSTGGNGSGTSDDNDKFKVAIENWGERQKKWNENWLPRFIPDKFPHQKWNLSCVVTSFAISKLLDNPNINREKFDSELGELEMEIWDIFGSNPNYGYTPLEIDSHLKELHLSKTNISSIESYIKLNRTLYGLIDWKNGTYHFVRIVGFTGVYKVEQIIAADTWTCNPQLPQNQGVQYGEYKNYEPSDFKEIYVEY